MKKFTLNKIFLIASLIAVFYGCHNPKKNQHSRYPPDYFTNQSSMLETSDIEADVQDALLKKDYRFLVCVGWGSVVPGVPWSSEMREKFGTRILDGTGDMVFGEEHERYKLVAGKYAEKYNELLLENLKNRDENHI